jgi:hypothetical protein
MQNSPMPGRRQQWLQKAQAELRARMEAAGKRRRENWVEEVLDEAIIRYANANYDGVISKAYDAVIRTGAIALAVLKPLGVVSTPIFPKLPKPLPVRIRLEDCTSEELKREAGLWRAQAAHLYRKMRECDPSLPQPPGQRGRDATDRTLPSVIPKDQAKALGAKRVEINRARLIRNAEHWRIVADARREALVRFDARAKAAKRNSTKGPPFKWPDLCLITGNTAGQ